MTTSSLKRPRADASPAVPLPTVESATLRRDLRAARRRDRAGVALQLGATSILISGALGALAYFVLAR